jgi:hypothetical protein
MNSAQCPGDGIYRDRCGSYALNDDPERKLCDVCYAAKVTRERIVVWLRKEAAQIREEEKATGQRMAGCSRVAIVADAIERGDK